MEQKSNSKQDAFVGAAAHGTAAPTNAPALGRLLNGRPNVGRELG